MSLTIALNPELEAKLLAEAKQQGQSLDTFLQQLLSQALGVSEPDAWLGEDSLAADLYSPVALLDDDGVIALAQMKLDAGQNQRLGDLQAKGKAQGLTQSERYELLMLMQSYRLGLLRKSEALAEAKARGLSPNLAP
ncbi:hypothetical protein [Baaleninema sp.]|uniref:hypothetical protein n=1 Tax=Baaleninema sp. TaxID=3101197 RepID=UPI003CFD6D4A